MQRIVHTLQANLILCDIASKQTASCPDLKKNTMPVLFSGWVRLCRLNLRHSAGYNTITQFTWLRIAHGFGWVGKSKGRVVLAIWSSRSNHKVACRGQMESLLPKIRRQSSK